VRAPAAELPALSPSSPASRRSICAGARPWLRSPAGRPLTHHPQACAPGCRTRPSSWRDRRRPRRRPSQSPSRRRRPASTRRSGAPCRTARARSPRSCWRPGAPAPPGSRSLRRSWGCRELLKWAAVRLLPKAQVMEPSWRWPAGEQATALWRFAQAVPRETHISGAAALARSLARLCTASPSCAQRLGTGHITCSPMACLLPHHSLLRCLDVRRAFQHVWG